MNIQPLKLLHVILKTEGCCIQTHLINLSDEMLTLSSDDYIHSTESLVHFVNSFFNGQGIIKNITHEEGTFRYFIEIYSIHFQPGLLINEWS